MGPKGYSAPWGERSCRIPTESSRRSISACLERENLPRKVLRKKRISKYKKKEPIDAGDGTKIQSEKGNLGSTKRGSERRISSQKGPGPLKNKKGTSLWSTKLLEKKNKVESGLGGVRRRKRNCFNPGGKAGRPKDGEMQEHKKKQEKTEGKVFAQL